MERLIFKELPEATQDEDYDNWLTVEEQEHLVSDEHQQLLTLKKLAGA